MNYQVIPLFSVPLYHANLGPVDPIARAWIMNLDYPYQSVGVDSSEQDLPPSNRGMQVLNQAPLKQIKSLIMRHVDLFVHDVLGVVDSADFVLTTSWVNRCGAGDVVTNHTHQNSLISGVYYIDIHPDSSPILFKKSYGHANLFQTNLSPTVKDTHQNQFNIHSYCLQPISGDLLLFPSHLEHQVPLQTSSTFRYSLAFNLIAKGTWGWGTTQITI